jgi:YfiH family protein
MTATANSDSLITTENEWPLKDIAGLPLVLSPLLSQFDNLKHAFTTRLGGVSPAPLDSFNLGRHMTSDESRADAMNNRRSLCRALALNFESLVVPGQVHSKNVVLAHKNHGLAQVDGVTVTEKNVPALLHFADCVPIVIFAPKQNVVSVVHAGWRGTAARIVVEAVELMKTQCDCQADDLVAAIGPAIGPCCYPTGEDAAKRLKASLHANQLDSRLIARIFENRGSECRPNLKAINAYQLVTMGLTKIDISNACTACRPQLFYSHRLTNGKTGRQGVIACLI